MSGISELLAGQVHMLRESYAAFDADTAKLVEERTVASGLRRFIFGGKGSDEERRCLQFQRQVEDRCRAILEQLPRISPEEAARVSGEVVDVMLAPRPARSNDSADLMVRAVSAGAEPFLPWLTKEQLLACRDRMKEAYPPRFLFPVEKQLLRRMDELLEK